MMEVTLENKAVKWILEKRGWDKTIFLNRNPNIHKHVLKTRSGIILRFHASGYKGDIRSNFP
jgi:hypothetical protein